jgi:hypothetical protein
MNIHDLAPKRRRGTLHINQILHLLQFNRCLGRGATSGCVKRGERFIDEGADFVRGGIVADYLEEVEGFALVCFADELEDVV